MCASTDTPSATRGTLEVSGQLPRVFRRCPLGGCGQRVAGAIKTGMFPITSRVETSRGTTAMGVPTPAGEGGVGDVARQGAMPRQLMR